MYNYELCIMNYELIFMSDIAIKVENLSKYYRLGVINNGTLFKDMQSWFARLRGKEDPHAKIGSTYKDSKEGFWALKDLNFEIKKGDRVGIIGHNGAGKSTLLKVLSQITTPTEGNIKINGRVASLLEVGTGFHPEMTGRENIYMNGAILGMKKSEIDKKVDQIIEFSEIGEHIDTPVKRYSSGMYVRLAFAVAAHLDSDILIADEVLAVGDAAFQKKALGKMNELSTGEGRTVLFVSHQEHAVKNLCNKGIILKKGRIIYKTDDINDCFDEYNKQYFNITKDDKTTFWENDGSFTNQYIDVKKIQIEDENGVVQTDELSLSKNYFIRCTINVKDYQDNILFGGRILLNETYITGFGIPEASVLKVGLNELLFELPHDRLFPGSYKIKISSSIRNTSWIVNPDSDNIGIKFTIGSTSKPILGFVKK